MQLTTRSMKALVTVATACGLSLTAGAQIGTGWTTDSSSHTLQKVGSTAYYNNSSGIETFRISSGDERSEIKINNTYSSGSHQFEGYVNCRSGSNQNSVQQVVKTDGTGDVNQLRIYSPNGGELKVLQTGVIVATGVYGVYQRVNCLHYRSSGRIEIWINGHEKSVGSDTGSGQYYFKYGVYLHGEYNPQTQWKSIKCWKK